MIIADVKEDANKMKVEIELPEIEGFEKIAEFRRPKKGERFWDGFDVLEAGYTHDIPRLILKPVEKWIVPTMEYLQKYYRWGELVEARFKDFRDIDWEYGYLTHIRPCDDWYQEDNEDYWKYCEIKEVRG